MTRRSAAFLAVAVISTLLGFPSSWEAAAAVPETVEETVTIGRVAATSTEPVALDLPIRASMIGLSFDNAEHGHGHDGPLAGEIRWAEDGAWSDWAQLTIVHDEYPDEAEAAGAVRRLFTEPQWTGGAERIEIRPGEVPLGGARVHLINTTGDAHPAGLLERAAARAGAFLTMRPAMRRADAAAPVPSIVTREGWGADESIREKDCCPRYADAVNLAFVHHTAGDNSYTRSESPAVVRGIYRYHVKTRGWSDIGYNFLVDRYGTIYEGRYGGMERPVIGAHTQGFNTGSTGISLMGTFTSASPTAAMLSSLKSLLAWKMDVHHVPVIGTLKVVSGGSDKYPKGTTVTLNRINGHRDGQSTACPGQTVYDRLPSIRSGAHAIGHPKITLPGMSVPVLQRDGDGDDESASFTATISEASAWRLSLADAGGTVRREYTGSGTGVSLTLDGRFAGGGDLPSSRYTWTMTAANAGGTARAATGALTIVSRHPDGTLLADGDGTYWVQNDRARPVTPLVERAWFHTGQPGHWRSPVAVGSTERARYGAGTPLGMREGALLESGGARYIFSAGTLRMFGEGTFGALGYDPGALIPATAAEIASLPAGPPVSDTTAHPPGTVVRDGAGDAWLLGPGSRRPVPRLALLSRYRAVEIVPALPADLAGAVGSPVPVLDGQPLDVADDDRHWLVTGGMARRMPSAAFAAVLGIDDAWLLSASAAELSVLPEGEPLLVVFRPPFADDDGWLHEDNIIRLAEEKITGGCGGDNYCPARDVTRAQMATFLVKALDLPPTPRDYFTDDDGSMHEANINALAAAGITGGCAEALFCPKGAVTRAEMATFLVRGFGFPPSSKNAFADDDGSPHEANINALAASGVTGGCGGGRYCPLQAVTRGQMATFIIRSIDRS